MQLLSRSIDDRAVKRSKERDVFYWLNANVGQYNMIGYKYTHIVIIRDRRLKFSREEPKMCKLSFHGLMRLIGHLRMRRFYDVYSMKTFRKRL